MPKITPNLWFDTNALEAAEYYVSVFPNSHVGVITYYPDNAPTPGGVLTVNFELDGQEYTGINGGPQFTFDEAISFVVNCDTQDEVDYYWEKLSAGGAESQCGWLKDRFGLSWQVVPAGWEDMLASGDAAANQRMMDLMYGMKKLDVAALQAAFDGEPVPEKEA